MRKYSLTLLAAALVFVGAGPARAHHAFAAEFDAKQPVKFEKAIVTKGMPSEELVGFKGTGGAFQVPSPYRERRKR